MQHTEKDPVLAPFNILRISLNNRPTAMCFLMMETVVPAPENFPIQDVLAVIVLSKNGNPLRSRSLSSVLW